MSAATAAGMYRADLDARTTAIMLGGAIDAVVAESLTDPSYDLRVAADAVVDMLHRAPRRT
ncbi:hypothetical protein ACIBJE_03610 [Micromonospora sp. NPDC050187]|uniref:hypothetical protein n=1 Tax=Micromonospora sp. NPDC050187 TaxID=3364277 RepID=UPI00379EEC3B